MFCTVVFKRSRVIQIFIPRTTMQFKSTAALSALSAMFVIANLPAYAADLAGAWLAQSTEPTGVSNLFFFEHDNASWSGFVTSPFGKVQLRDISVEGNDISFKASLDLSIAPSPPPSVTYHGTLGGEELRLTRMTPDGQPNERIARRVSLDQSRSASLDRADSVGITLSPLPYNGLAASPPMGWNSWNKFELHTDDALVREVADALAKSGLRDAGYVYVNIDDGWQGKRDAHGVLHPNERFPDMKALVDYVHSRGLKFGLYSSPGPSTCAHFEGSYGHEEQDARMYAEWGVDYLKYDWCSGEEVYNTPAEMQGAYLKMGAALRVTGRPIVYALCQYGLFGVGEWGRAVGANLWRTSSDIHDTWQVVDRIGFSQDDLAVNAGPGGWNDPDMLEVGNGAMSLEEYRTHFTLWAMLSAPLLLGNDVRHMSDEIKTLLTNRDVIAIDQDSLGKQAARSLRQGKTEIWSKKLADGDAAVAFFNRDTRPVEVDTPWSEIGLTNVVAVRDLWNQKNLDGPQVRNHYHTVLPPHGTVLLRLKSDKSLNVVFIGDSITQGFEPNGVPDQATQYLSEATRIGSVRFSNQGHAGYTTVNFLPSRGETFSAVERAAATLTHSSNDTLVFSVMLGTNDSAMTGPLGSPVSPVTYRKNLQIIIDRLLKDYPRSIIVLNRPIWYSPNTYNASRYLADGLKRLESYFTQIDTVVESYGRTHPGRVFAGDKDAFEFFEKNYQSYLKPEEGQQGVFYLHPNEKGTEVLGRYWATAISKSLE